ncbi:MAG: GPR endopeptidase [Oscillospiraceae bacterium]
MIRTDLAIEFLNFSKELSGVTKSEYQKGNVGITKIDITEDQPLINKPKGKYITFSLENFKSAGFNIIEQSEIVAEELVSFLPQNNNGVLIVGLGNSDITPDALGPYSIGYIFATRHINGELKKATGLEGIKSVCSIAPGVLGQTGIEVCEVVSSLVKSLKPDYIITIDALAAQDASRLCSTIQVSDAGISPGSGVQNARKELSQKTLGIPVIAMGVPTVIDMSSVYSCNLGMMVTPKEIDMCIEHASKTIAYAINKALQPALSMEELISLVG